jgi:hypothetical protein
MIRLSLPPTIEELTRAKAEAEDCGKKRYKFSWAQGSWQGSSSSSRSLKRLSHIPYRQYYMAVYY